MNSGGTLERPEPSEWPDDARRDRLIGDWHIYQRTGGHRTSTDDLITAWYAVHRNPQRPARYLDLGCGVGSVLLMVSHKLRPPVCHGVEAQAQSVAMAVRAIEELPSHECELRVRHADFRDLDVAQGRYDLVTGSPPYFPLSAGVLPQDAQRRACRFETRGGVEAYVQAATRVMTDDARFYLVFQTQWSERVLTASSQSGLHLTGRADFRMRADRDLPFLSVFELARTAVESPHEFHCAIRDASGTESSEYEAIRRELGVAEAGRAP